MGFKYAMAFLIIGSLLVGTSVVLNPIIGVGLTLLLSLVFGVRCRFLYKRDAYSKKGGRITPPQHEIRHPMQLTDQAVSAHPAGSESKLDSVSLTSFATYHDSTSAGKPSHAEDDQPASTDIPPPPPDSPPLMYNANAWQQIVDAPTKKKRRRHDHNHHKKKKKKKKKRSRSKHKKHKPSKIE